MERKPNWQSCVGLAVPCSLSLRVCNALTADEAQTILADAELSAHCQRRGVQLESIVANWRHPLADRITCPDLVESLALAELLGELTRRDIRFVLIGGLAGRIYCSSYATSDLDICHERTPENLEALAEMLVDIGAEYRRLPKYAPVTLEQATLATETDFVFNSPLGKLDLIGEFTGVGNYEDAVEDAISVDLDGVRIQVLSLPKLTMAKLSTGRPKDLLVHTELETVRKACEKLELQG